jgi:hypothetical protein
VLAVDSLLQDLMDRGLVRGNRGYYFVNGDESVINHRLQANALAQKRMRAARFYSALIAHFPFVRAVLISGSLSKGVMTRDADIDFFIITEPGRLWITRMLLTLFKRFFLLNSHRNFCLNYFIDSDHLAIPDRNIFTATEIGLILPVYNPVLYQDFLQANDWIRCFYPNLEAEGGVGEIPDKPLSHLIERLMSGQPGDRLDDFCMRLTRRFVENKYRHLAPEQLQTDLEASKGVSRHHPESQEYRILRHYRQTSARLAERLSESLNRSRTLIDYGKSA